VVAVLVFDGLTGTLSIISGLLLLMVYHPFLLAFDLLLLLAMAVLVFVLGRGAIQTSVKESKYKHKTAAWLQKVARYSLLFKSHGGLAFAEQQAEMWTRRYLQARHRHFRVVFRQIMGGLLVQVLASTGLLLVGGWLVISQQLTLGQLVASELVVSVLVASVFKVVKSFEKFYDMCAALDKVGKVVDLELETEEGLFLPPSSSPAALSFVDLGHRERGLALFQDFNLEIRPGERVALSASNIDQVARLGDFAFGLDRPEKGMVLLNNNAIPDLRLEDLRRAVALVRDTALLEGTILENMQMGCSEVGRAEVRRALSRVGLLPYVMTLSGGVLSTIQEANFSRSQKKLLVLARALSYQPNILILDGLLDDLDPTTLVTIFQRLFHDHQRTQTVLVFTHREDVITQCDRHISLTHQSMSQRELTHVPT
ncbi:MAG: ABC transporter ATP-binding protein, partial [Myxococcota bacterium]